MREAEDGWLARVRLPGGRATTEQLDALVSVASLGSGLVDITRRANVQIRGLSPASGPAAASTLADAGLLPSVTHERLRNIVASPFGGRHPQAICDTDAIVEELDRELCADGYLQALPERFGFGVDDGSRALADLDFDVELGAETGDAGRFRLSIGGSPTDVVTTPSCAARTALDAARAFLGARESSGSRAWHVREIPGGATSITGRMGAAIVRPSTRSPQLAIRPGVLTQRDGRVAITALAPLGRLNGDMLCLLAGLVRRCAADVRFSAWRTVTVVDVSAREADGLADAIADLGLLLSSGSGWEDLTACVGAGACAKARVDVRAAVAQRAGERTDQAPAEHWSACERRCGEPKSVPISVAATDTGLAVTVLGHAIDVPDTAGAIEHLADERPQ